MKCVGLGNDLGKEDFAYISNTVSLEATREERKGRGREEKGRQRGSEKELRARQSEESGARQSEEFRSAAVRRIQVCCSFSSDSISMLKDYFVYWRSY